MPDLLFFPESFLKGVATQDAVPNTKLVNRCNGHIHRGTAQKTSAFIQSDCPNVKKELG